MVALNRKECLKQSLYIPWIRKQKNKKQKVFGKNLDESWEQTTRFLSKLQAVFFIDDDCCDLFVPSIGFNFFFVSLNIFTILI